MEPKLENSREPWLIPQIQRLAHTNPDQFRELVQTLQSHAPDVYETLAIMAVEHGELTPSECAVCLCTDERAVDFRLEVYRKDAAESEDTVLIQSDAGGVARLAASQVTVWEVVREYRKAGSVENLKSAFPGLSESELRAALFYAGRNPDEIGAKIREYEEFIQRTKTAYPFA